MDKFQGTFGVDIREKESNFKSFIKFMALYLSVAVVMFSMIFE